MSKRSIKKMPFAARIAIFFCISVIFGLCLCLLMSAVALASEDPTKNLATFGEGAFICTMFFCALLASGMSGEAKFASGIVSSLSLLLVIIAVSLFVSDAPFSKRLVLSLLGLFVSSVGAYLGSKEKKRRKKHHSS